MRSRPDCTRPTSPPTWIVPDADLVERPLDDRLLDVPPQCVGDGGSGSVEERVVQLVEVELVLEHAPDSRTADDLAPGRERSPGDEEADQPERDGDRARAVVLGDRGVHERLGRLVDPMQEWLPDAGDDDQAADRREHREHADRDEHRRGPFAVALVRVLLRELARLASEHREVEAERVEAGQQGADQPCGIEERPERVVACERRRDDSVLRPEAGEDRYPRECKRADEEGDVRARHERSQAAHPADVLLAAEVMDHDAGAHEQQRLEERVRHKVEDRVAVRTDPGRDEHVADLRHRRVRDDALDVPLHERDHSRDEERDRAEDRGEVLDVRRRLEDRARADEQVDAGGDHRRRVDQRGDRCGAFHRVREPGVEWDLRRLRHRAAEEAERDEVHRRRRQRVDVLEHAQVLERSRLPDEQDEPERERRVADRIHHERLLRSGHRFRAVVPEADQEVRREADETPAGEQEEEVPRLHEQQHREDEERHVGEVATLLVVAGEVAHRVPDDEPAHARDDQHHRARERVEEDLELDLEVARLEPGVSGREVLAVAVSLGPEPEEGDEGADERDEGRERRDPARRAPGDAPARESDRQGSRKGGKQTDPGAGDHPRSALAWSTSRSIRRRAIATIRPRPIATSAAATAITASAKI